MSALFVATGWHGFFFVYSRTLYIDTKHNQLKRWHYVPREMNDVMKWNGVHPIWYINVTIGPVNVKSNNKKLNNYGIKSVAQQRCEIVQRMNERNDTTKSSC